MRVFISWSGEKSKSVAASLRDWLPDVIQDAEPFMSASDIGAGARWASELAENLEKTDIGILCLTPENLNAPWLVFEAGSLAKKLDAARVVPYRLGLKATEVPFPLAQFQSVDADREGTLQLLKTLNSVRPEPIESERLERLFCRSWGDLEQCLSTAETISVRHTRARTERDLLEEILVLVRNQTRSRNLLTVEDYREMRFEHVGTPASWTSNLVAEVYWHIKGFTRDEALEVCGVLKHKGIPSRIAEHQDPRAPDSVFVGALVPAEAAQVALRATPYTIQFIFRPDYPDEQGGSSTGLKIGLGYRSTHLEGMRQEASEPTPLTEADLSQLLEPGISNVEFHRRLRRITCVK